MWDDEFDDNTGTSFWGQTPNSIQLIGVHELSEFTFCPRAGQIARETDEEDPGEDREPLGPKLSGFWDYSEHRFNEEIMLTRKRLLLWTMGLFPSVILIFALRFYFSRFAAVVGSSLAAIVLTNIWNTFVDLVRLLWTRRKLLMAVPSHIDLTPLQVSAVSWWTLRKAGFECRIPKSAYFDKEDQLVGRPWRVLSLNEHLKVPVVRKHKGQRKWGKQHIIRLMAYCRMLQRCEQADVPFGVLMFNDSDECMIIPNLPELQSELDREVTRYRTFLAAAEIGLGHPAAPHGNRCRHCHLGKPRVYEQFQSETVLNGEALLPMLVMEDRHCTCGDRYRWTPPHEDIEVWQQRKREELES